MLGFLKLLPSRLSSFKWETRDYEQRHRSTSPPTALSDAHQAPETPRPSNSRTSSFYIPETSFFKFFLSKYRHFMFLIILESEEGSNMCGPPIYQHLLTVFGRTLSVFFFFLKTKILIESPTEKL